MLGCIELSFSGSLKKINLANNENRFKVIIQQAKSFIKETRGIEKWDIQNSFFLMLRDLRHKNYFVPLDADTILQNEDTIEIILTKRIHLKSVNNRCHKLVPNSRFGISCDICDKNIEEIERSKCCTKCELVFHVMCIENRHDICHASSSTSLLLATTQLQNTTNQRPKSFIQIQFDNMKKKIAKRNEDSSRKSGSDENLPSPRSSFTFNESRENSDESVTKDQRKSNRSRVRSMVFSGQGGDHENGKNNDEFRRDTRKSLLKNDSPKDIQSSASQEICTKAEKDSQATNASSYAMMNAVQKLMKLFKVKHHITKTIHFKNFFQYKTGEMSQMQRSYWVVSGTKIKIFRSSSQKNLISIINISDITDLKWYSGTSLEQLHLFEFKIKKEHYMCGMRENKVIDDKTAKVFMENGIGTELARSCFITLESLISNNQLNFDLESECKESDRKSRSPKNKNEQTSNPTVKSENDDLRSIAVRNAMLGSTEFSRKYDLKKSVILGAGSFGIVVSALRKSDSKEVAVKVIVINVPGENQSTEHIQLKRSQQKNELMIILKLDHPGCVRLYEFFEVHKTFLIVMEKMEKFCMLDVLSQFQSMELRPSEKLVKFMIFQVAVAVNYLHSLDIAHCDLKPDNVLVAAFKSISGYHQVKICDFGFSKLFDMQTFHKTLCGTLEYMAPEIINNQLYDKRVDLWSLGVMIYVSLALVFPFSEKKSLLEQVENKHELFPFDTWKNISPAARDLIDGLIRIDSGSRTPLETVLKNYWLIDDENKKEILSLEQAVGEKYLSREF